MSKQRPIVFYISHFGSLVIKEQAEHSGDNDRFICVTPEAAPSIIARLQLFVLNATTVAAEVRRVFGRQ